jgi:DUF1365 family protein
MKSKIFKGKVFHKRITPVLHHFTYKSYFLKLSLNELSSLENAFFSINRFNLFSFHTSDHGYKDQRSLQDFAKNILTEQGFESNFDDIILQTTPRILGHVFNPVSFWYVVKNNKVFAIIAEVNNTFSETFSYVINPQDKLEKKARTKKMQVSPFNQIKGHYTFHFLNVEDYQKVDINYFVSDQLLLHASVNGHAEEWNAKNFLRLFFNNPLQNFLTLVFIHYQALRLYLKKIPFYGKNGVVHE